MNNRQTDPFSRFAALDEYDLVGCSTGVSMHRVVDECPISGDMFSFVTSLTNVPPGLIAYLYKTRWDIEKIFDQVKNKLPAFLTTPKRATQLSLKFIRFAQQLVYKHFMDKGYGGVEENLRCILIPISGHRCFGTLKRSIT